MTEVVQFGGNGLRSRDNIRDSLHLEMTEEERLRRIKNLLGPRGFLSNWPEDVVAVVNGRPVTKADILERKRRGQERRLARIRQGPDPRIQPCFVWAFYNDTNFFSGWWLYVRTLKREFRVSDDQRLKIMRLFPCGYLPMIENYGAWREAFAKVYHHPTRKRPTRNGLAMARAMVSITGQLLDILPFGAEPRIFPLD